ncbi:UDP-N-acetylmuramoyl-L-alanyl-D-glutamate--2,6-diaminopimelate ligase [Capnocytophaga sp. oral taxon 863 str. F0517]|jgi:UDP-N-acetylmuramoyl-L-alanyl-D-glutamate--2,6-diaminopimelate ligase|uniref:UDP-N-acetylmuramoyl-L-alanyl-D-glutamate--2, 6-diaminopimelate ligase n=1 Tax=Capnocytophaga sp. oral taxon 863 TaxID=1227265 RepID=UPI000398381A|nr:UDP-N-acetylmuramoyl-L-alanyl-D-glutamate--2,6-diaminopimelate ligase [Capnocytophaga sp. oral taxon 863]ERI63745.1 UDP-N-acetylmuramoyl-L-alanyl-D-glutamate--2,6-diaminopimelate ligase [Capnocytophaga sp. oral taxon 863 str. F0517]
MTLKELLKEVNTIQIIGNDQVEVTNLTQDSRKISDNTLFFAIKGAKTDGHSFISQVVVEKVKVVVCEVLPTTLPQEVTFVKVADTTIAMGKIAANFYGNPSKKLKLVGVTGTNGKTTIATLLYQLFGLLGHKVGLISTIAIYIDQQRMETKNTTPDVLTLNEVMHRMVEQGVTHCFMEVSSHGVALHRIEGLHFSGGVFTNLTQDHLDFHNTLADYRDTKKKFFDSLSKTAFALTNIDDKNGSYMLQNTPAKRYSYALKTMADFRLSVLENTFSGMLLRIETQELWVSLIGKFNAYNLLAIYATAKLLGVDTLQALLALSRLTPVAGRFQYFVAPDKRTLIVDYAHTPDALENVLETIRSIKQAGQQLITLVGCGGNRDKGKRPIMAHIATSLSDKVILTSDNPREEDPEAILQEMEAGIRGENQHKYMTITDRRQAIKVACHLAHPGDIILLAGKGHETYQEIKGVKTHFDDLEEGKKVMSEK